MANKVEKTNAARLLDRAGIKYQLIPYKVDENNLAADHVAAELGEDINRVFKTLVLEGDREPRHFVCVIPGNLEVDLKKAAKAAGVKKADLIPMKQAPPAYRLHTRRLHINRHEEEIPYIFPLDSH